MKWKRVLLFGFPNNGVSSGLFTAAEERREWKEEESVFFLLGCFGGEVEESVKKF
jgi:hypothetical protein